MKTRAAVIRRWYWVSVIVFAFVLWLVAAGRAQAYTIVYRDAHRNVWIATPTGSVKRQLTKNGNTKYYMAPSETDTGTIVVGGLPAMFYYFNQSGKRVTGPWTSFDMKCASLEQPDSNQVRANNLIVYSYVNFCPYEHIEQWVAFANYGRGTAVHNYAQFPGSAPRWVPGKPYAAAVTEDGESLFTTNKVGGTVWVAFPGRPAYSIRAFDISRKGYRVLIATASTTSNVKSPSNLVLWRNNGVPPAGGRQLCVVANWAEWTSVPRFSPDGKQFTWSAKRGVYVSPTPVANANGRCTIHPRPIVRGGLDPDWGVPGLGKRR